MFVVKAFSLVLTAIVAFLAARHLQALFNHMMASRVRAPAEAGSPAPTHLRQDPRTGVYFPEL